MRVAFFYSFIYESFPKTVLFAKLIVYSLCPEITPSNDARRSVLLPYQHFHSKLIILLLNHHKVFSSKIKGPAKTTLLGVTANHRVIRQQGKELSIGVFRPIATLLSR